MTVAIIIALVVVVIILWLIGAYNSLVSLRNKKDDQWSQIDIQLKRRFDLIPNLVETVKGYAKHEKETFENVTKARSSFASATTPEEEMKANGELTKALSKLMVVCESYPELKANENFIKLQEELKETEDKISYARQFYNDSALSYNNKVEMFPSNIVANIFGFKKASFFEIDEASRENPTVKF